MNQISDIRHGENKRTGSRYIVYIVRKKKTGENIDSIELCDSETVYATRIHKHVLCWFLWIIATLVFISIIRMGNLSDGTLVVFKVVCALNLICITFCFVFYCYLKPRMPQFPPDLFNDETESTEEPRRASEPEPRARPIDLSLCQLYSDPPVNPNPNTPIFNPIHNVVHYPLDIVDSPKFTLNIPPNSPCEPPPYNQAVTPPPNYYDVVHSKYEV